MKKIIEFFKNLKTNPSIEIWMEKGQAVIKKLSKYPGVDFRKIDKFVNWTLGGGVIVFWFVAIFFFAGNLAVLGISIAFLILLLILHNFNLIKSRNEEQRLSQRAEQLATLQGISLSLNSTLNLPEVCELIPCSCVKLIPADGCVVSLIEKVKDESFLKDKNSYGIQTDLFRLQEKNELNNSVIKDRDVVYVFDITTDRRNPRWTEKQGFHSYLGIPLIIRDDVIGVISLYTKEKHVFTLEEKEMLSIFATQSASALENARLYSVTKSAMQKEITAAMSLYKIEKSIAENKPELKEQLDLIMESALKLTNSQKASIWLVDEITSEIVCKGVYPMEKELLDQSVRMGEGVTGWVAKEGSLQNISNLSKDIRFVNILNQDLKSELSVPLKHKDKVIGVLNILNKRDAEGFTEADEHVQTVLAEHAALALKTTSLYQELRNAAAALSILYEISRTISEGQNLQRVLNLILKRAIGIFEAQNGSIMLLDETNNELTIKVAVGLSEEIIKSTRKKPGDGSIAGWVAKEQEPQLLIGRVNDPRFRSDKHDIKDSMCAPIKIKNKLIGVLNISNHKTDKPYSESDLNLACILANDAGMVIETAKLYELTTQHMSNLSNLYVITKSLSSTLNLQIILNLAVEKITLLFSQMAVTICLLDVKKQILKRTTGLDFEGKTILEDDIRLKEELKDSLEPVLSQSRNIIFTRVETNHPHLKPLIGQGEINSIFIFPLESKDRIIGLLTLASRNESVLSNEDLRFLTAISHAVAIAIDNARIYEQTKRRVDELAGIQNVVNQMALNKDVRETLVLIINAVNDVIGAELGLLYLWNEYKKEFVVNVGQGKRRISETTFKTLRFKMGEGSVGWVGENRQNIIMDEPRNDSRFKPLTDIIVKNLISVPISKDEVVIGVMEFMNKPDRGFNEDDLRMITIMTQQVVILLENSKSFEDVKRRALQLSAVHAINKIVSSITSTEDLLPQLIELISKVMRVQKACLILIDEQKKVLKIEASFGLTFMEKEREDTLDIGRGIAGRVAITNKPLIINNIQEDTTLSEDEKDIYLEKTYLCVPLNIRKRLRGVISVSTKLLETPFNEQDLELLSIITEHVGMVIEYANVYGQLQQQTSSTVKALSVILETRDPFTKAHSDEVAKYAIAIAKEMHLSKDEIKDIEIASLVHDIGKIGIKESILLKPDKELSIDEHRETRNHPFISTQILRPLPFMKDIIPIVYHHHERYDGDGYLDGLKGKEIPLGSRILAVADVFDMMTSERAFRDFMDDNEAIDVLKTESGKQFDPQIVKAFLKVHPVLRKEQLERVRVKRHEERKGGKEIGTGQKVWERYT